MKTVATDQAPAAIGPYAQAVQAGEMVFASGQIPLRPDGTMVEGGITAQVQQVLANVDAILLAAGTSREQVVKTTIFMTNLADFQTVNERYADYFGSHRPARSTIQVAALPRGAEVEIECIAIK